MKPIHETYAKMRQRVLRDCEGVAAERQEQEALAPQYFRFVDSRIRMNEHWKRIIYIVRLFGWDRAAKIIGPDKNGILRELTEHPNQFKGRDGKLPIWKGLREYLREEDAANVADIQAFLESVGYENVSRQAIESVIKRHPETFTVATIRKERIVCLKLNEEAESGSDEG